MTYPAIVFPDATYVVITALNDGFSAYSESAVAYEKVPATRPAKFVVVRRTGGPQLNQFTDLAQVTVESYGASVEDAHDLAQLARALLRQARATSVDGDAVYRVDEISGPAELPDPLSDQARFSQTFAAAIRGNQQDP